MLQWGRLNDQNARRRTTLRRLEERADSAGRALEVSLQEVGV